MSVRRSTNTENLVRGADTLLHQGTMLAKAALWAISSGVLVGSVVVSIGAYLVTTSTERTFAYKHIAAKTKVFFSQEKHSVDLVINGNEVSLPADQAAIVTSGIFEKVRASGTCRIVRIYRGWCDRRFRSFCTGGGEEANRPKMNLSVVPALSMGSNWMS